MNKTVPFGSPDLDAVPKHLHCARLAVIFFACRTRRREAGPALPNAGRPVLRVVWRPYNSHDCVWILMELEVSFGADFWGLRLMRIKTLQWLLSAGLVLLLSFQVAADRVTRRRGGGGGSAPRSHGLTATAGNQQVGLSWTAVPQPQLPVKRSTTTGGPYMLVASPPSQRHRFCSRLRNKVFLRS